MSRHRDPRGVMLWAQTPVWWGPAPTTLSPGPLIGRLGRRAGDARRQGAPAKGLTCSDGPCAQVRDATGAVQGPSPAQELLVGAGGPRVLAPGCPCSWDPSLPLSLILHAHPFSSPHDSQSQGPGESKGLIKSCLSLPSHTSVTVAQPSYSLVCGREAGRPLTLGAGRLEGSLGGTEHMPAPAH